jgi:hypothetical protein
MKVQVVSGYSIYTDSCGKLVVIKGHDLYLCNVRWTEGTGRDYWQVVQVEEKEDMCLLYTKNNDVPNYLKKTEPSDVYREIHKGMTLFEEIRRFILDEVKDSAKSYVSGYPVIRKGGLAMIADGDNVNVIYADEDIVEIRPHHKHSFYMTVFASGLTRREEYLRRTEERIVAKKDLLEVVETYRDDYVTC